MRNTFIVFILLSSAKREAWDNTESLPKEMYYTSALSKRGGTKAGSATAEPPLIMQTEALTPP